MSYGQLLEQVIEQAGESKEQAAMIGRVSPSSIRKYIKGTRKSQKDVMQAMNEHYDDPFLAMASANEVTNNAYIPVLNNVDLHRASTHIKTMEEMREAMNALSEAHITKRRDQMSEKELRDMRNVIMECIEAVTALTHHIAVMCKEYCFSWIGLWKEHRQELKGKRYMN